MRPRVEVSAARNPHRGARHTGNNKLINLHSPLREARCDLQLSAHGFHKTLQRAHVHVGTSFQLRDCGLIHSQDFREVHLRHLPRFAQQMHRHLRAMLFNRTRERSSDSGDIFASNSRKFLAIYLRRFNTRITADPSNNPAFACYAQPPR
jgi:hypothetical protein